MPLRPPTAPSRLSPLPPALAGRETPPAARPADLVVYGRVWTGDSRPALGRAVAVGGDTIVAVGDSAEIAPAGRARDPGAVRTAPGWSYAGLHGRPHSTSSTAGFQLASVDLRAADVPAGVRRAGSRPSPSERQPGEWILGGDWDHERWPGTPLPDPEWIDSVTPEQSGLRQPARRPHGAGQHARPSRRRASIGATPDIPGGVIVRDRVPASRPAFSRTRRWTRWSGDPGPLDAAATMPRSGARMALRRLEGCHRVRHVSARLAEIAALPARPGRAARSPPGSRSTSRSTTWHAVADTDRGYGRGDDWVRIGGVKGYMDGSLGSTTALFYAALHRRSDDVRRADAPPRTRCAPGSAPPTPPACRWPCTPSASGPTACCSTSTTAWRGRTARATGGSGSSTRSTFGRPGHRPHRAASASSPRCSRTTPSTTAAGRRSGSAPSGSRPRYAFRSLARRGSAPRLRLRLDRRAVDPILGIYAAVTRRTLDGKNPERLGAGAEDHGGRGAPGLHRRATPTGCSPKARRGRLKPGYLADLVLLDRDLTRDPAGGDRAGQVVRRWWAERSCSSLSEVRRRSAVPG